MKPVLTATIVLEPLTAVHVWSGEDAVAGIDLVRRSDGKLCLVDYDRIPLELSEKLAQGPLGRMVQQYADKLPCKLVVEGQLPSHGSTVKLINNYIVPGSSLKGYIRTAIMYYLLSQMNRNEISQLLGRIRLASPKNAAQPLEESLFRARRLPRQGGFVDSFQSLHVSDPLSIRGLQLRLKTIQVRHVHDGSHVASIQAIVAARAEIRYSLKVYGPPATLERIVAPNTWGFDRILEKLGRLSRLDISRALRSFGCSILDYELSRIRGVNWLADYRVFLENLQAMYCGEQGECFIARLGFSAGYMSKTVLGLLRKTDPGFYKRVASTMSRIVRRAWDDKTVKLVDVDGRLLGMGWCRLCLA